VQAALDQADFAVTDRSGLTEALRTHQKG